MDRMTKETARARMPGEGRRASGPIPSRRADPELLHAVSEHMGQPWASAEDVLAIIRDEYALRVFEDGLTDSEESWEAFLAHWADWAQERPAQH
jgi:hypothetical protein